MRLAEMTSPEVTAYLETADELIIPLGTCEQHGKHLPLANDILLAEYFADFLSARTGIPVAPTVNYGVNLPCDGSLAGTAGLDPRTLRELVTSLTGDWRRQGFSRFLLLNFHGDPFHLEALSGIGPGIHLLAPWEIEYGDVLEAQTTMRHACEAETSMALHLYPEKVHLEGIEEHDIPFEQFADYLYHRRADVPPGFVGCLGRPSLATPEKGERLVRRMEQKLLELYREIRAKKQDGRID